MQSDQEVQSARTALAALTRTTGLATRLAEVAAPGEHLVTISADAAHAVQLPYEVKRTIDRRDQLVSFKAQHGEALLITRSLSTVMKEHCRDLDIQFVDHDGNCYLRQPGLFVFVTGLKDPATPPMSADRGLTPAALRVVLAALTLPSVLNSNVRRIAAVASISHGAAGIALVTLEQMGLLVSSRTGRMIVYPERWLDIWTEGYLGRIRPSLAKHRMTAPGPVATTIEQVVPQMREIALGGECAASLRGLGLKPGALTLYVDLNDPSVMRSLVQELRLRRDPAGNIELVSMFWNANELPSFPTVPDALIYADLVGLGDPRALEIAAQLKTEISNHVATAS